MSKKRIGKLFLVGVMFFGGEVEGQSVAVPVSDGRPVMTDGLLGEGEWGDALSIPVGNSVILYLKEHRGHVFVGLHCGDLEKPFAANLFLVGSDGSLHELHVSAQIGERVLAKGESEYPGWVWGYSPGWYANEARWDQSRAEALITEGWSRTEAQREALFPQDGFEFQILRSRFPSEDWIFRLEVLFSPDYDSPLVFPAGTSGIDPEGWMRLSFPSGG